MRRLKLVACYVVFNEAHLISESLRSIKAYVDEYVIVDSVFQSNPIEATHSTDNTRLVCETTCPPVPLTYIESDRKLTEQDARNLYLSKVSDGDWILWLDGDEVLYGKHEDILRIVADLRSGKLQRCLSIPTFTTAILYHGLGKDMPPKEYATNPLINTVDYQTKFFQKHPGYHYINLPHVYEDACYDERDRLVTDKRQGQCEKMFVINHHARQSHGEYVNDCVWALKQRSGRQQSR